MHPDTRRFFAQVHSPRVEEHETAAWLYQTDKAAFRARQLEAHETSDVCRLAACGHVALQHGDLSPKHSLRYRTALLAAGDHQGAVQVLTDPRFAKDDPESRLALATALVGVGRLAEAAEAAAGVPQDAPGHAEAAALRERLVRLIKAEPRLSKGLAWPEIARIIDVCFDLGLPARGAPWLRKAAALPDLDETAAMEILGYARPILRAAAPHDALDLLLALRPVAEAFQAEPLIDRTARMLVGRGPEELPPPTRRGDGAEAVELCCGLALAARGARREAIQVLGRVAVMTGAADRARHPLAAAVGQDVIERTRPSFRSAPRRKVVDVFPFFDELLLLEMKLEEMAGWVDHFVILEATQTFTGKPKPLHFWENRQAFARYADKIVHIAVDFPPHVDTPWAREFHQRDIALPKLAELCGEDDLVLLTDVDEIIRRDRIEGFSRQYASLLMPTYSYFFNVMELAEGRVMRGSVWRAKYLQNIGLSTARLELIGHSKKAVIHDAGWHFSSIRETADLPTKFRSYSHVARGKLTAGYFEALMDRIRAGQEPGLVRCELDDSFPQALLRRREGLQAFLL